VVLFGAALVKAPAKVSLQRAAAGVLLRFFSLSSAALWQRAGLEIIGGLLGWLVCCDAGLRQTEFPPVKRALPRRMISVFNMI
jgi:hypothetical protein